MTKLLKFNLFLFLTLCYQLVYAATPIEAEFMKFFNVNEYGATHRHDNVKINVDRADNLSPSSIKLGLEFDLKAVEKVLILKIPESGYNDSGGFNEPCSNDDIFIAGYTFDPNTNVSELGLRIRSRCGKERIRLLVWVRVLSGKYYLGTITFNAYVGDKLPYW